MNWREKINYDNLNHERTNTQSSLILVQRTVLHIYFKNKYNCYECGSQRGSFLSHRNNVQLKFDGTEFTSSTEIILDVQVFCRSEGKICKRKHEICGLNLIPVRKNETLWLPYMT